MQSYNAALTREDANTHVYRTHICTCTPYKRRKNKPVYTKGQSPPHKQAANLTFLEKEKNEVSRAYHKALKLSV